MSTKTTSKDLYSQWGISTDIYDIVGTIDKLKARYVDDENETTLALGIFGFIGDTEAKKIQTATIMTGELGNEMFATRAKLDKNVITHAIYVNALDINAVPPHMNVQIGIKEDELIKYLINNKTDTDAGHNTGEFYFNHENPILVGSYEFHFDYDIRIKRSYLSDNEGNSGHYVYTANYIMDEKNMLSDITNPYLIQPIIQNFNNFRYVFFQTTVRQVHIETIEDTMITDSIIDNKSYTFNFTDQLADFEVYVTEDGITTRLQPYFYGSSVEVGEDAYCWYMYVNEDTVRIGFDPVVYIPGLNANIKVVVKTTKGFEANFDYNPESTNSEIFVDFQANYTSTKLTCFVRTLTDSSDGTDMKSVQELKALIPKLALSHGYITTETDLRNYFDLISTPTNKLQLQKKVDNQLQRIWYAYFVMRDDANNIIPTNTIRIKVNQNDDYIINAGGKGDDARYIIPSGTCFVLDPKKGYAVHIDESEIPTPYTDEYFDKENNLFYYKAVYNTVINIDPLYASYYMSIVNHDSFFEYEMVNENAPMGFSLVRNHIERYLLSSGKEYRFSFTMAQSINDDFGLCTVVTDRSTGQMYIEDVKMKVFLVIYKDKDPYRYAEMEIQTFDESSYTSSWLVKIETDDIFDLENRIKLLDLYEVGYGSKNYGFFDPTCEAYVYICAKFEDEESEEGYIVYEDKDKLLSKIVPGLDDYTLVNIYKVNGGISFFHNYTNLLNTRVRINVSEDKTASNMDIIGFPVVGEHFFDNSTTFPDSVRPIAEAENAVVQYIGELNEKKAYIDYCLTLIENTMNIDFKFFNTYGPSVTYLVGDTDETDRTYLDRIDIQVKLKVRLVNSSDIVTRDAIIVFIKQYVENLNEEIGSLHFNNMLHDIKDEFNEQIEYIDYIIFNEYNLGIYHITLEEPDSPHTVPEFINIRNRYKSDGYTLEPCIDVDIVVN